MEDIATSFLISRSFPFVIAAQAEPQSLLPGILKWRHVQITIIYQATECCHLQSASFVVQSPLSAGQLQE